MYDAAIHSCAMVWAGGTCITVRPSSCQASRAATFLLAGQASALWLQGFLCSLQASNAQMSASELGCLSPDNIILCHQGGRHWPRQPLFTSKSPPPCPQGLLCAIQAYEVSATSLITDILFLQTDIFSPVRTYLERLWSLWEMMLLAKPIMVVAPTPGNSQRVAIGPAGVSAEQ